MIGYISICVVAIILGQVVKHLNLKMPPVVAEEITYKEYYSTLFKDFKFDIKYSSILIVSGISLIYFLGNIYLAFMYLFLFAILLVVFSIDFRFQLIPDEAHIGIALIAIINMIFNGDKIADYFLGALVGGGIFLAISGLALLIYRKEGMGFGDVKLMAALGLLFGVKNILVITLVSFFIGAIIGIIVIIFSDKDKQSYLPFGPFIVIAAVIIIFINPDDIINLYISLCTSLGSFIPNLINGGK